MAEIEEMEKRLAELEARDAIAKKESKRLDKIKKMPFHKQIQQTGFEDQLERTKEVQEWALNSHNKKHKTNEDFKIFWNNFLKGKCISLKDYLQGRKD